ncbi:GNAT family N-acetyltransferase [Metabacillus sp. KIGAM252]|uniref:GNAT family N-acetyltransferase n=1 Tax=Metabacillus flavus TaxID=2823519 RepID=A0ABS5LAW6_9BACI|nr:GNAT family N-acetyltransferase [Metabacillus flavus]MBS2967784.1 GNAT family N-acetyltransferase [Metabacillus flavus]
MTIFSLDLGEIILREFTVEDASDIYRISNEPVVASFLPDWKSTMEQRLDWVTNYEIPANKDFLSAAEMADRHLKLGIIHKESGRFIGWCCSGIKDELPAPNREVMYAVSAEFTGRGYATLAVKGLSRYLFEEKKADILNAVALENNPASNRVIEKSGFQFLRTVVLDGENYNHYVMKK